MKRKQVKAKRKDVVIHNGARWTVLDREFDTERSQSFYLLKTGRRGSDSFAQKWVRSDYFTVA